jgi:DNA replication protein DnaC
LIAVRRSSLWSIDRACVPRRTSAALLDRLTHKCHIFEMNGESYRFRESMRTKKDKDAKKAK